MLAAKVLCNMPSTSAAPVAYAAIRRRSQETSVLIYAVEMLAMQLFFAFTLIGLQLCSFD
jgi:hypothetical protein